METPTPHTTRASPVYAKIFQQVRSPLVLPMECPTDLQCWQMISKTVRPTTPQVQIDVAIGQHPCTMKVSGETEDIGRLTHHSHTLSKQQWIGSTTQASQLNIKQVAIFARLECCSTINTSA